MKGLVIGCLLFTGISHAESFQVKVENFNFTYQNPYGEGSASSFSRTRSSEGVHVKVEKVDKDFHLSVTGSENQEFVFKDAPSFMTDAESMTVKGFNLDLSGALTLNLSSGRFLSEKDSLKLDGVSLSCSRDSSLAEDMDQLISGCMKKMRLKSSKFSTDSLKSGLVAVLEESFHRSLGQKANIGVNALDLETQDGKYELAAEVKAQISGKVKSKGNMSYDPATGIATLKISEVKFGFLNITGKVFDELKKNESEKLKVKKPYVYYTIK